MPERTLVSVLCLCEGAAPNRDENKELEGPTEHDNASRISELLVKRIPSTCNLVPPISSQ